MTQTIDTTVAVSSSSRLSNSAFHRSGGNRSGQARWWLRGPDGFIEIPQVRGDSRFSERLDLEPGHYTLGTGTGRDAIRETFDVVANDDGTHGIE